MGQSAAAYDQPEESQNEILRSCREEVVAFQDPTIMLKLQLQLAIAEERYEDAARLRNDIERVLSSDRELGLVVALETALEDQRFEVRKADRANLASRRAPCPMAAPHHPSRHCRRPPGCVTS